MSKANELIEEMDAIESTNEGKAPKGNFKLISVPKGLDKGKSGKLVGQVGSFDTSDEHGTVSFKVSKLRATDRAKDGERISANDTHFSVSGVDGEDMEVKASGKKLTLITDIAGAQGGAKWEFEKA